MTQQNSVSTSEPKEYTFKCDTCGVDWSFKINRAGPKRCKDCTEIRRSLNGFVSRGISLKDLKERIEKILSALE